MANEATPFSKLPSIQAIDHFLSEKGYPSGKEIRAQLQQILSDLRNDSELLADPSTTRDTLLELIAQRVIEQPAIIQPVINGTGAIIHTNLGRSVYSKELFEEVIETAISYTNLEFSLETGRRGSRVTGAHGLLQTITGAEDAVVVNNNAAAVVLVLSALASKKEVIISRGELVEIGGSFRIPEIIETSGALLKEVGTTNRTHLHDYQKALSEETAILLKVHHSNYEIQGFTAQVSTRELANLAHQNGKLLVEDIGSGAFRRFQFESLNTDPLVPLVLKNGADIVTISGDKLVGGPQAGIILGKQELLKQVKNHPLYRALRVDKLTLILLEKSLQAYIRGAERELVPTQRMLNESPETVRSRAESVLTALPKTPHVELMSCQSTPGGGSLPGKQIPSWGLCLGLEGQSENQLLTRLRKCSPPIIGRIQEGKALLDFRTILPHQVPLVIRELSMLLTEET